MGVIKDIHYYHIYLIIDQHGHAATAWKKIYASNIISVKKYRISNKKNPKGNKWYTG